MRTRTCAAILAATLGMAVASQAGAMELANGLTQNGLTQNGLTQNGLTQNGLTQNGLAANGVASDASRAEAAVLPDGSLITLR